MKAAAAAAVLAAAAWLAASGSARAAPDGDERSGALQAEPLPAAKDAPTAKDAPGAKAALPAAKAARLDKAMAQMASAMSQAMSGEQVARVAPSEAPAIHLPKSGPIGAVERVEHFDVTARAVVVDAFGRRIEVLGDPAALARAFAKSILCPELDKTKRGVLLACTTRQIDAALVRGKPELRKLRIIPVGRAESASPIPTYLGAIGGTVDDCVHPERLPGDRDPVVVDMIRAECAFIGADDKAATALLTKLLDSTQTSAFGAVRLGDIAILHGDVEAAMRAWDEAGGGGPFSRIAAARLCEIDPVCATHPVLSVGFDPFDAGALPFPLSNEVALRHARALAFHDDIAGAAKRLLIVGAKPCVTDPALCRAIAREALREHLKDALAFYAVIPDRASGAGAWELAGLAADAADDAGAPRYGAQVLSETTELAPAGALEAHLVRTAELFLAAGDDVRARAILSYAETRFQRSRRVADLRDEILARSVQPHE